jgi:hypothetical protein
MDLNYSPKGKKGSRRPEMSSGDASDMARGKRGISMEPGSNPFFFNDGNAAKQSTPSLLDEDRYRLVKIASESRSGTPQPGPRSLRRMGTESSLGSNRYDHNANLMSYAQSPSMSLPPRGEPARHRGDSSSSSPLTPSLRFNDYPGSQMDMERSLPQPEQAKLKPSNGLAVPSSETPRDSYFESNAANIRKSNNYLTAFFTGAEEAKSYPERNENRVASEPSSIAGDSAASTTVESYGSSLKTPISSISDEDPLPAMPPVSKEYSAAPTYQDFPMSAGSKEYSTFRHPPRAAPQDYSMAATAEEYSSLPPASHSQEYSSSLAVSSDFSVMPPTKEYSAIPPVSRQYPDPPTQPSVERRVVEGAELDYEEPEKHHSFEASLHNYTPSYISDAANFGEIARTPRDSDSMLPPVPALRAPPRGHSLAAAMPVVDEDDMDVYDIADEYSTFGGDDDYEVPTNPRMSVLMRPLPADDPLENPEERANRIRSFYKEYFDDSKPQTSRHPMPRAAPPGGYYEDYDSEFMNAGTLYDAEQHGFVVAAPFAQPVTRRAMTPPPRAPPRFNHGQPPGSRSRATSNAGSQNMMQTPRGHSAMSSRGRQPLRRPMPPPQPLNSLPTPHRLKDDTALFNAMDFAPPVSYRERQNGRRPESPLGERRPYSPAVRAFVPLNSSFDELAHIPSP